MQICLHIGLNHPSAKMIVQIVYLFTKRAITSPVDVTKMLWRGNLYIAMNLLRGRRLSCMLSRELTSSILIMKSCHDQFFDRDFNIGFDNSSRRVCNILRNQIICMTGRDFEVSD